MGGDPNRNNIPNLGTSPFQPVFNRPNPITTSPAFPATPTPSPLGAVPQLQNTNAQAIIQAIQQAIQSAQIPTGGALQPSPAQTAPAFRPSVPAIPQVPSHLQNLQNAGLSVSFPTNYQPPPPLLTSSRPTGGLQFPVNTLPDTVTRAPNTPSPITTQPATPSTTSSFVSAFSPSRNTLFPRF